METQRIEKLKNRFENSFFSVKWILLPSCLINSNMINALFRRDHNFYGSKNVSYTGSNYIREHVSIANRLISCSTF